MWIQLLLAYVDSVIVSKNVSQHRDPKSLLNGYFLEVNVNSKLQAAGFAAVSLVVKKRAFDQVNNHASDEYYYYGEENNEDEMEDLFLLVISKSS